MCAARRPRRLDDVMQSSNVTTLTRMWATRTPPCPRGRCAERRRGERRARAPAAAACLPGHGAPARRRAPGGPRMTQRGPRLGGPGGANRHIRPCGGALGRNGFASARRPGPGIPKRDTNLSKTTPFQRLPYASATRNYQCGSRAGNRPADGQGPDGRANSVDQGNASLRSYGPRC